MYGSLGVCFTLGKEGGADRKVLEDSTALEIIADCEAGPATINYPPPEGKQPDASHVQQTTAESAHLYRFARALSQSRLHR